MIRFHVKFGIIGLEQIYSKLTELHDRTCSEKKNGCVYFEYSIYERKTAQYYNYTALETMQGNLSRSK